MAETTEDAIIKMLEESIMLEDSFGSSLFDLANQPTSDAIVANVANVASMARGRIHATTVEMSGALTEAEFQQITVTAKPTEGGKIEVTFGGPPEIMQKAYPYLPFGEH